MNIDALHIWEQLINECQEAKDHYSHWHPLIDERKGILQQGAADFDRLYDHNNKFEETHYLSDLGSK